MNRFAYYFLAALLVLLIIYWFIDGRPTTEGYGWLFGSWAVLLVAAVVIDRVQSRRSLNDRNRPR